jgi:hypothetical protein
MSIASPSAVPEVFVSRFVEMAGDLLAQVALELAHGHQPAYAQPEDTQSSHVDLHTSAAFGFTPR